MIRRGAEKVTRDWMGRAEGGDRECEREKAWGSYFDLPALASFAFPVCRLTLL